MKFTKMHGAGNDYVFVDGRDVERDWPALSVAMSDRHLGIGSDGLIVLKRADVRRRSHVRCSTPTAPKARCAATAYGAFARFAIDKGAVAPPTGRPSRSRRSRACWKCEPVWQGRRVQFRKREHGRGYTGTCRNSRARARQRPRAAPSAQRRRAHDFDLDVRVDGQPARRRLHRRTG